MDNIDVLSLRGEADKADVIGLVQRMASVKPDRYRLVCIDALYRAIPAGTSESDNAQMMQVYNQLDRMARLTGAAIVLNHHATKGDQSGKAVTDVGSGAGAISRATDTHLVIRPHEDDELCVLDAVTRSFAPPESQSIRFLWPLWEMTGAEPKLRQAKTGKERQQEASDAEGREAVLEAIGTDGAFAGSIRTRTGYGQGRVTRLLAMLKREGVIRGEARPCNRVKEGESMFFFRT
jgi:RecA-family ATPase